MAKTIRDVDEDKVKDYKEDIDTLLVFVSVFLHVVIIPTLKWHRGRVFSPQS